MAKSNTNDFQQKVKVLNKLFENGYDTEKKLQQLNMECLLKIQGITISDMAVIIELQKQTKTGRLYSYLSGAHYGVGNINYKEDAPVS